MFNLSAPKSYKALLDIIPEENIYTYIFNFLLKMPVPEIGAKVSSPLREDSNPSFNLYINNKCIRWKDFGLNQSGSDALALFRYITKTQYNEALEHIYKVLVLNQLLLDQTTISQMAISKATKTTATGLTFRRNFELSELAYWNNLGIGLDTLKEYNVLMAKEIWFNYRRWARTTEKDPIYLYLFSLDPEVWQLYRPKTRSKKNKFRSKNIGEAIMGIEQIPKKGDVLVLTSSMKDVMLFSTYGIPAISSYNEQGMQAISWHIMTNLKYRFKKIISIMDNDKTGRASTANIQEEYPFITNWEIPELYGCKDPSDLVTEFGRDELTKLLTQEKILQ